MKPFWRLALFALCFGPFVAGAQGFTPPAVPQCTLTANPYTIEAGERSQLKWTSKDASRGTLPPVGNIAAQGTVYVTPSRTTEYAATFTGPGGTVTCKVRVTVVPLGGGGVTPTVSPTVSPEPRAVGPAEVDTGGFPTGGTVSLPTAPAVEGGGMFGLIPAECSGSRAVKECDFCALGQLLQNVINFLLAMSILIAAVMFAYAGVLFFTNQANPAQITKAWGVLKNVALGFFFALAGWLIIQTILSALVDQKFFVTQGKWNALDCTASRQARAFQTEKSVQEWLRTSLPGLSPVTQAPPATFGEGGNALATTPGFSGGSCSGLVTTDSNNHQFLPAECMCPQSSPNWDWDNGKCYGAGGDVDPVLSGTGTLTSGGVGPGSRGRAQCAAENINCSVSVLAGLGLTPDQANAMSCIAVTESSGNPVLCSGTGPCGTFQITRTNWQMYAPPDCQASNFGGNIVAAQNNGACNIRTAVRMVGVSGYQPWTGLCNTPGGCNPGTVHYVPQGTPWNSAARSCVQNWDPSNLR